MVDESIAQGLFYFSVLVGVGAASLLSGLKREGESRTKIESESSKILRQDSVQQHLSRLSASLSGVEGGQEIINGIGGINQTLDHLVAGEEYHSIKSGRVKRFLEVLEQKSVHELISNYRGKTLSIFMGTLMGVSEYPGIKDWVDNLASSLSQPSVRNLDAKISGTASGQEIMEKIAKIARYGGYDKLVDESANIISFYGWKLRELVVTKIYDNVHEAYFSHRGIGRSLDYVRSISQESVKSLYSSFSGEAQDILMRSVLDFADISTSQSVDYLAQALNQDSVRKVASTYNGRELQRSMNHLINFAKQRAADKDWKAPPLREVDLLAKNYLAVSQKTIDHTHWPIAA